MSETPQKTIMVAEDESDLGSAIKAALTTAGFNVVRVADGQEAVDRYREIKPDMMLLDLNMPKLNGTQVLTKIREDAEYMNMPVSILTAQDDIATVSDVTVIGGMHTDFLPKADRSLHEIVEHVKERLA